MRREISRGLSPQHQAVKAAITAFVRAYGLKRGLPMAADAIGMGERAARHAHEGGDFAADNERAARADAARLNLLLEQIQQLHAEAASISIRGLDVGMGGPSLDGGGRVLRDRGDVVLSTRAGALT